MEYRGGFELNGLMVVGPVKHKTNIKFRNMDDFASYVGAIYIEYDREDVTVTGYVYKLNTPQFKVVKQPAYAKRTNYMKKNVDYRGQNLFILTCGNCSMKSINSFTEKVMQKNY